MKHLATINPENVTEKEASNFRVRRAARAVVFDENNLVALLPVTKHNYYKLPGGGIEDGEEIIDATKRECMEEIGCEIEIIKELGEILEFRANQSSLKQTSYCFIAKVIGEKGKTDFTKHEIDEGFIAPIWVPISEAIELVSKNIPRDYNGPFIVARDKTFLEEAVKQL